MNNNRILSLDALRGLAIFTMIFVDASPGKNYAIFKHAAWEGLTIADLAFPGFIFAMGASAAVSMSRRQPSLRKIFRRAVILFVIGILFNTLPHILAFIFWDNFTAASLFEGAVIRLRFFGILQRLALTYLFGMLIVTAIKNDAKILISAVLLLIVSSLGFHIYAPENPFAQSHNISAAIDLLFANHIYTPTHDPDGLYGTIASTASMLFGFWAGRILINGAELREKFRLLIIFGAALLIVGGFWSHFDIISKQIWTAPFALITAGVEAILLAGFLHAKKFLQPLYALGRNPLLFFLASNFLLMLLMVIRVDGVSLWILLWQNSTGGFISVNFSAALFCLLWCLLWIIPAEILNRLNIIVKI